MTISSKSPARFVARVPVTASVLIALLSAVLLVASLASPVAHAAPKGKEKQRGSWSVVPAGENGGDSRSSYLYTLRPGAVLRDKVAVTNTGSRPVTLDLYGVDAYQTEPDGAFALRNPDEPRTGVGAWVTLGKNARQKIKPGKGLLIPFEIRIPRNAEPGDHAGAVVAAGSKAERSGGNGALGFDVRRRVGARIYVRVEGPLKPGLAVKTFEATATPALFPYLTGNGEGGVDYTVTNSGNARMTPEAEVRLLGPFGGVVHQSPVTLPELLPGASVSGTVEFESLPPLGLLRAELVVTSEDASARESSRLWSVPWAPLALLLLLGFGWWLRRRAKTGRPLFVRGPQARQPLEVDEEETSPTSRPRETVQPR